MREFLIRYRKIAVLVFVCTSLVLLLSRCINNENTADQTIKEQKSITPEVNFSGSESCNSCHTDIYNTHSKTAHFKSSSLASASSIKGSFDKGKNSYLFSNGSLILMENRNGIFHQTEFINGVEKRTHSIDIVIGSATKGQSFLYWGEKRLYQHPMTYFTSADQWTNSPGYPNKAMYQKPVTGRCMECHATYAGISMDDTNKQVAEDFDKEKLILGIGCERCHGPGVEHVSFHQQNPTDSVGKHILNPAKFSRRQKLDLCALCHAGGLIQKKTPSFQYMAGDKLSDYFNWDTSMISEKYLDVHGNQYGLMMLSQCYQKSGELTCNSCHNPHINEKTNLKSYSARCMNCHNEAKANFCTVKQGSVKSLSDNCIDCHMPKQMSRSIAVQLQGESVPTPSLLRTHYVRVYNDETMAFISEQKKLGKKRR